jgi:Cysteine rich repeat
MANGIARWSLVTVILVLVGPAAFAQSEATATQPVPWAQGARFRMDCGQDLHRFCYGVQPGEGRLIQCLSSHRGQLSPACISRLAAARPTLGVVPPSQNTQSPDLPSVNPPTDTAVTGSALRASCGPDVQTLCRGMYRNNGGVVKCLSSHRMELSQTCDAFFKEMLIRRAAQKGAPKTTPPIANGPVATPAASGAADTAAPSAVSGPANTPAPSVIHGPAATPAATDTGAPSTANGATDTAAPSLANGPADTAAPSAAHSPAATPEAANGAATIGAPSPANGPAATPEAANGTLAPSAVNGPATTSALPAANAATGAAPAAKKPPAKRALDFPL